MSSCTSVGCNFGCLNDLCRPRTRSFGTPEHAVLTAHGDGLAADGYRASQEIALAVKGHCGPNDLNRGSNVQAIADFLTQVRSEVSRDRPLFASDGYTHADGETFHVLSARCLDVSADGDFTGRVIVTKALCSAGGGSRRLGTEWNGQDRKQQAAQQPRDQY